MIMKAIINPYNHTLRWCEEFFPDRSICSLPVAGKMTILQYKNFAFCYNECSLNRKLQQQKEEFFV